MASYNFCNDLNEDLQLQKYNEQDNFDVQYRKSLECDISTPLISRKS